MSKIKKMILAVTAVLLAACGTAQPLAGNSPPAATAAAVAPASASPTPAQAASRPVACTSPAPLTVPMMEGPYFTANSPERASLLEAGMKGTKLTLSGYVLTTGCKPVAHALLDFWQANADGQYDNTGYTLRGHQYSDDTGRYELTTLIPGLYPGRTEHIHVKVQAPGGPLLTTQLFFPGVAQNDTDGIFDPSLVISMQDAPGGKAATFDFIVQTP